MILLPLDEGYALDYLAVLYVKRDEGLDVGPDISRVEVFLHEQIPHLREVMSSIAFKRLLVANAKTFDAIELAHRNEISARRVQEVNYERFKAKRALQRQFWPKSKALEQKTKL